MKFFTIFFLLLGALGASGHGSGLTCSDGYIFLCLGAVLLWFGYGRRFVRQAIAEGRQKEAAAVRRYREKVSSAPVGNFLGYYPEEIEEESEAPSAVPSAVELVAKPSSALSALVEGVRIEDLITAHRVERKAAAQVEPEAVEADYDPFCRNIGNLPKEKERLERVLWGLYNKRDKWEYMGKSHTSQAWKGLEWDINEIERRLEALKAV